MILVLDFGSQYTQLIARRVREQHVYCEIHPYNLPLERVRALAPEGIILSGGPASVYAEAAPFPDPAVLDLGVPVLGVCYGMGVLALRAGGPVARSSHREFGHARVQVRDASDLFADIDIGADGLSVWMSHGDRIEAAPAGFEILAASANSPVAAFRDRTRRLYGLQFHPE